MLRKIKYNQQLIMSFWCFINIILFLIFWFNAYFNYPVNNTWGNKVMGSAFIAGGNILMFNLLIFVLFLGIFYIPYATFKLFNVLNRKMKINKKATKSIKKH